MTDFRHLEAELRALGAVLDVPPAPDVVPAVRRRLERQPTPRPTLRPRLRAVLVGVMVALGLLIATPQGRAAVEQLLRFAGIDLRQEPPPPRGPGNLPGERRMTLDEARRHVTFPILIPSKLGQPTAVIVSDGGRVASLIYQQTPYGAVRLDQFDGRLSPVYHKSVAGDPNTYQRVDVNGQVGLWVKGPHVVQYVTREGREASASARLAGNTLIWDTGRVAVRLEGTFTQDQALRIARSTS